MTVLDLIPLPKYKLAFLLEAPPLLVRVELGEYSQPFKRFFEHVFPEVLVSLHHALVEELNGEEFGEGFVLLRFYGRLRDVDHRFELLSRKI